MQSKGVIKFFLILFTVIVGIQFLYMVPTMRVESDADAYAQRMSEGLSEKERVSEYKIARTAYLDSMSSEKIFRVPLIKDFTYEELKSKQLALGLDLKGGMSVILQVDLRDFIKSLANNSEDPEFNKALDNASERFKTSQSDYVTLFGEEYQKVAGGKKLSNIFILNESFRDRINFETPDGEIIRMIRSMANETVKLTYKRLKDRIDKTGVVQPNVSLDENRDLIIVELPGFDNPERARKLLQATAKLEFYDVYRITDQGVTQAFLEADSKLKRLSSGQPEGEETETVMDTVLSYVYDSLGQVIDSTIQVVEAGAASDDLSGSGPLLTNMILNMSAEGLTGPPAVMGTVSRNKKHLVSEYLARPDIKALFPRDLEFRWAYKPAKDFTTGNLTDNYQLYGIRKKRGSDAAPLEGDRVTDARTSTDPNTGEVVVSLNMDSRGARIWADMTTKAAQDNNREVAILLDDEVVSAPSVRQPITGGSSQISGDFSLQEATDLSNILQIGKLPAKTRIIQESLVGPSLGQENIDRSLTSVSVAFFLLLLFMVLYYVGGGVVSIIALFANLFFIIGGLASYGTVLTLPGIAGIVLTMGMAVDANVIIYERIREELRHGKTLGMAIRDGYQQSYSAIIDANVTTILTALVLAYFGLGPIKGFAIVLIIGVLFTLFTAVLLTRLIIDYWIGKDRSISFASSWSKNVLANVNINWIGMRRYGYMISGALILAGTISFFVRGFELGVDMKGGYSYNIQFDQNQNVNIDQLRNELTAVFDGAPVVKAVDTRNTFNVTTSYGVEDDSEDAAGKVMAKLFEGVNALSGGTLELDNFKSTDGEGTHVISSNKVGATIAEDIKDSSFYSALFALLLIFLYLFIRFNKWQFSLGAVAALLHDVLATLSIFTLLHGILPFSMEIDQAFVAAILTVIGYSVNDTVIVFDRIREFMNSYTGKAKEEVFNLAINNTLSRTIITSGTTILVVGTLFLFGGASIKGFAFAMLFGIIFGTYSSVFVASALVVDLSKEREITGGTEKKKGFSKHVATSK
jgi:SecD/SecF fusion protein